MCSPMQGRIVSERSVGIEGLPDEHSMADQVPWLVLVAISGFWLAA